MHVNTVYNVVFEFHGTNMCAGMSSTKTCPALGRRCTTAYRPEHRLMEHPNTHSYQQYCQDHKYGPQPCHHGVDCVVEEVQASLCPADRASVEISKATLNTHQLENFTIS